MAGQDVTLRLRFDASQADRAVQAVSAQLRSLKEHAAGIAGPMAAGANSAQAVAAAVGDLKRGSPTLRELRNLARELDDALEDAADPATRQAFAAMRGELGRMEAEMRSTIRTAQSGPPGGLMSRLTGSVRGQLGIGADDVAAAGGMGQALVGGLAMGAATAGVSAAIGAASAAVAGLGRAMKDAVATGMEFDATMSKVQAKSGASALQLEHLRDQAIALGGSTTFSASEVAAAMVELGAAGMSTEQIMNAVPGVLAAAASEGMGLADAATVMSDTLTQFGLSADQASRVADVLAQGAASSSADIGQMGHSLRYAAPAAAALGMTMEDTTAAVMGLAAAGIRGEQAGTTLRGGLLSLVNPGKQASDAMERIGFTITDAQGKVKPFSQIIGELARKTDTMTEAERTRTVAQIVGTEASSGFLALLRQGQPVLEGYRKGLDDAAGAAERMAAVQTDNLKGDLEELGGAWEALQIRFEESADSPLRGLVQQATEAVRDFTSWVEDNAEELAKWGADLGEAAGQALALGVEVAKLGALIDDLSGSLGGANGQAGAFQIVMNGLRGTVMLANAAVAAAVGVMSMLKQQYYEWRAAVAEATGNNAAAAHFTTLANSASQARQEMVGLLNVWQRWKAITMDPGVRQTPRPVLGVGGAVPMIPTQGGYQPSTDFFAGRAAGLQNRLTSNPAPSSPPTPTPEPSTGGSGGGSRTDATQAARKATQAREEAVRAEQAAQRLMTQMMEEGTARRLALLQQEYDERKTTINKGSKANKAERLAALDAWLATEQGKTRTAGREEAWEEGKRTADRAADRLRLEGVSEDAILVVRRMAIERQIAAETDSAERRVALRVELEDIELKLDQRAADRAKVVAGIKTEAAEAASRATLAAKADESAHFAAEDARQIATERAGLRAGDWRGAERVADLEANARYRAIEREMQARRDAIAETERLERAQVEASTEHEDVKAARRAAIVARAAADRADVERDAATAFYEWDTAEAVRRAEEKQAAEERAQKRRADLVQRFAQVADGVGQWLFERERQRLDEQARLEQQRFDERQGRIDAEEQAAYDRLDAETGRKQVLSAEEAAYENRRAAIAAEAEAKRQKLQAEQDKADLRRRREQAVYEKKQAVWKIVLGTMTGVALAISEANYVKAGIVAAEGAIAAGVAAAQPLPQFATGVTNFQPAGGASSGLAIVGERGPEVVTLGRGANVLTNENVVRLMRIAEHTEGRIAEPPYGRIAAPDEDDTDKAERIKQRRRRLFAGHSTQIGASSALPLPRRMPGLGASIGRLLVAPQRLRAEERATSALRAHLAVSAAPDRLALQDRLMARIAAAAPPPAYLVTQQTAAPDPRLLGLLNDLRSEIKALGGGFDRLAEKVQAIELRGEGSSLRGVLVETYDRESQLRTLPPI